MSDQNELQTLDTTDPTDTQDELDTTSALDGEDGDGGEGDESGSAPDAAGTKEGDGQQGREKVTFTPEQQRVIESIIGKKTHAQREAERRAEEFARELESLRSQLPGDERPTIPPLPDPYDDNFAQKMAERDQAIQEAVLYDARHSVMRQRETERQRQLREQEESAAMEVVATYSKRAGTLGITADALKVAGNVVAAAGVSTEVARFILKDDKGPLITTWLARNPIALEELQAMDPMAAAVHLATVVKPKAVADKGQRSRTNPPPEVLGTGGAPRRERGPRGATYE